MSSYRPDQSDYLAHFTTSRAPFGDERNPTSKFKNNTAYERLVSILESGKIFASSLPFIGRRAACFTECPWSSLLAHAKRYSPYGIGFTKPHVFAAGGGPAYYVRADHWEKQNWDDDVRAFVTPFWPEYRPAPLKSDEYLNGKTIDFSHEREWRVPHDFTFKLNQVKFVIVQSYEDVAKFPKEIKDVIGRERFLMMDVYRTIEQIWPVHNVD